MSDIITVSHPAGAIDLFVPTNIEHPPAPATIGSSGGSGGATPGHGSPEGVVTASPGATYLDLDTNGFWTKGSGTGSTGWVQLIA